MEDLKTSQSLSVHAVWNEFKRMRLGLAGLILLVLFIITALFSPLITPYDPIDDTFLAESHAYPVWFTILPQYRDLPPNINNGIAPLISEGGWSYSSEGYVEGEGDGLFFKMESTEQSRATIQLRHAYLYPYGPPQSLIIEGEFAIPEIQKGLLNVTVRLETPQGKTYPLWSRVFTSSIPTQKISFTSKALTAEEKAAIGLRWFDNVASHIMAEKGLYQIVMTITLYPIIQGYASLHIGQFSLQILGLAFGLLGTDHIGADLFSQLVYGSRISLLIGILASLIATVLGVTVGVVAGYAGARTDEGLMRVVDVLLVLPFLPLLMVIGGIFGKSIWNLILLLGVLSWPGFARVVRAKTLQLKQTSFLEASKAMGASHLHIIINHVVPNVIPYIYAIIALSIPGFVITEAALSFLALGDPSQPSWGRMFYTARAFGAFSSLAWWWIIPPGILITLLSLSFVFIGHALDDVMNPRLRARR